ncbi:type II toxin-antitoxin system RelE/ParE family toxin [Neorhizobium galegae]|uniref:type II toxin-antitoxin system RelE/ParE family toxin n=1 Tax=Neorhizobium galegae TaxID=399 RepID=UPI0009BC0564|nr:type II toxin-antitoxin system RelE/ParE family toxin [Neorhizobium galegae]KAA9387850.1 type II toxin-antitoxin system RelE/ParE family toxin [Neorhizobium galegae]KAB1115679.1 type II toxin-antitoxin system RelE/ParE family toxin [Neorhizobium galegae]MCM2498220.1 type II toxin-antitoxin system RelE/ParE family toxin [Neorhizobium galegae]MCQ1765774.1 type II toxin-antitoxin system RelE/ParE family toxin [Neorhizobium galegae]MCQ1774189.1 type II toxin-antitoxin system RelE/ParE family to
MKVILSPEARETVTSEAKYLKSKSPKAAQQFSDDIKRLRQGLSRFPEMGRMTEEIPIPGVLRFVMGPYLVDYEIREDEVVIFAIRHGRERPPGVELDDDFDLEEPDGGPHQ